MMKTWLPAKYLKNCDRVKSCSLYGLPLHTFDRFVVYYYYEHEYRERMHRLRRIRIVLTYQYI